MADALRIAAWSVGEHAQRNTLPAINDSSLCALHGVYSRDPKTRALVASRYDCIDYQDAQDLLEDHAVDAVYLAGPTSTHFDAAKRALRSGKHVIVEKTAFATQQEAEEVVSTAADRGLMVMEAFMYRFHPQYSAVRDVIESERYGRLLDMRVRFGFPHLDPTNIRYSTSLAGGALNDAGAYTLSLASGVLGNDAEVLFADQFFQGSDTVDARGVAVIGDVSGRRGYCAWMFGGSYANDLDCWLEGAHLRTERIFSKPPTFAPSVEVSANGKVVESISVEASNHFVMLFDEAARAVREPELAALQRSQLLTQARLMASVRHIGSKSSGAA
ncbi:MAG: Gfo/Idh/MocA family oxidoreductase [Pseudomonadota bacterium]